MKKLGAIVLSPFLISLIIVSCKKESDLIPPQGVVPQCTSNTSPLNGITSTDKTITLSWPAATGATMNIYLG